MGSESVAPRLLCLPLPPPDGPLAELGSAASTHAPTTQIRWPQDMYQTPVSCARQELGRPHCLRDSDISHGVVRACPVTRARDRNDRPIKVSKNIHWKRRRGETLREEVGGGEGASRGDAGAGQGGMREQGAQRHLPRWRGQPALPPGLPAPGSHHQGALGELTRALSQRPSVPVLGNLPVGVGGLQDGGARRPGGGGDPPQRAPGLQVPARLRSQVTGCQTTCFPFSRAPSQRRGEPDPEAQEPRGTCLCFCI